MFLTDVLDNTLTLRNKSRVRDQAGGNKGVSVNYNVYQHLLEVLEALLVRPLLTDLLGDLYHGGVTLLPQTGVAPGDDLLPVLGHFDRLKRWKGQYLPVCDIENWEQLLLIFILQPDDTMPAPGTV